MVYGQETLAPVNIQAGGPLPVGYLGVFFFFVATRHVFTEPG
jgi:hypothetical protein